MTPNRRRPIPADMLLIAERRRRMATEQWQAPVRAEEILTSDEDQLIEVEKAEEPAPTRGVGEELRLLRPVEHVSLAQVGWSGPIDHDALQAALLCYPVGSREEGLHLEVWMQAPFSVPAASDAPALEVTLSAVDVSMLQAMAAPGAGAETAKITRAASLPERIIGAERSTALAVSPVLAAYRLSSLSYAWQRFLSGAQSPQLHRERDEAAVALLSTMRALLGER